MANNRLYLVDTKTKEYICLAKKWGEPSWHARNLELYKLFLFERTKETDNKSSLIIGIENDDEFYNDWIKHGTNYNTKGTWE